ncbi:hypothetical protein F7230_06885 [Corynebacterium sp. 320]|uniref:hypothetical protein n=1 Tax=Corynebacterium TaxID=1716 RepID=UPI00125CC2C0|nr:MULTISPECIES: hypothetical protein [Corynebacterium]KAB1502736.1 hypothetical protein F7230_06885 [Corynebacterium sp. 320]KAB1550526.1 hypothetical protein F7232_09625 [Corynebacterium sp. 319]KAB1554746.1 hypothetical protein F7233_00200 [Corynebacterium sp. 321]KAB3526399.1 hypothetical protein F8354_06885 [Corynebacterium sp. 250]KAB3537756.1 hypothetical protein F8390_09595 [Corynebacterium sp. 366]
MLSIVILSVMIVISSCVAKNQPMKDSPRGDSNAEASIKIKTSSRSVILIDKGYIDKDHEYRSELWLNEDEIEFPDPLMQSVVRDVTLEFGGYRIRNMDISYFYLDDSGNPQLVDTLSCLNDSGEFQDKCPIVVKENNDSSLRVAIDIPALQQATLQVDFQPEDYPGKPVQRRTWIL